MDQCDIRCNLECSDIISHFTILHDTEAQACFLKHNTVYIIFSLKPLLNKCAVLIENSYFTVVMFSYFKHSYVN